MTDDRRQSSALCPLIYTVTMTSSNLHLLDQVVIGLVETSLPENIGSAARAMKVMGLTRLALVAPRLLPDARANTLAAGADQVLDSALVVGALADALPDCQFMLGCTARLRGVELPAFTPQTAARRLLVEAQTGTVAVWFGSERVGLSNADLGRCHGAIQIATDPGFSSLNLAQAVQIIAYELRLAALAETEPPPAPGPGPGPGPLDRRANLAEMERYFTHLQAALGTIDFLKGRSSRVIMQRLRRMYLRAQPSLRELNILHGILSEAERQSRIAANLAAPDQDS